MSFGASLKVAAAELRKAAQQAKVEADELQRSLINKENDLNKQIAKLRAENMVDRAAVAVVSGADQSRLVERDLDRTEQKISELRREYEEEKRETTQAAQDRLQQHTELTSQATDLERRASMF